MGCDIQAPASLVPLLWAALPQRGEGPAKGLSGSVWERQQGAQLPDVKCGTEWARWERASPQTGQGTRV